MYQSTKIIDGFSTCFRQWRAKSHCSYLHGYSLKFKLTFQSNELDLNNWVADFGFLKYDYNSTQRSFKDWFKENFDHTTIIAVDDPHKIKFVGLHDLGVINVRFVDKVGCEAFAEYVWNFITSNLHKITQNPGVNLHSVECIENEKNSAIYYG